MRILLLNQHEAIIIDDKTDVVTVEPHVNGVLTVNGTDYPIRDGGIPPVPEDRNNVRAAFTTEDGITFTVLHPRIYKGMLTTCFDPYSYAIESRIHIDQLEKALEKTRQELAELRGSIKYDAAGFLLN